MGRPKKYKAKDLQGNWVTGWYVELHIPHYDNHIHDRVVGYDVVPHLFNDEEGGTQQRKLLALYNSRHTARNQ